ncbi:pseudouridine-5'-phosphate glycosidase [Candidatus Sumerlaeota bacterium]|nr:pseudouridine-5'-phosphate glycosidase [Candidatus Sumerlaeota bacterium]
MIKISNNVSKSLDSHRPVVALESAVISFGLPPPHNYESAITCQKIITEQDVSPATVGILNGTLHIGLTDEEIRLLASSPECIKTNLSNMAVVIAQKNIGATTVSATMFAAHKVGIKVFCTGGIGGVHPGFGSRLDISSDLMALAQFPLVVVCAGPKSLLDIPSTRESLESLGIPVIGYRTRYLPAFYLHSTELMVDAVAYSPREVVEIAQLHWRLGRSSAVLVCQPLPEELALAEDILIPAIEEAERAAAEQKISERHRTPFILNRLAELTEGATLRANIALLENNARLSAEIALTATAIFTNTNTDD